MAFGRFATTLALATLLACPVAAQQRPPRPPDGTYVYQTTVDGVAFANGDVTVSSQGSNVIVGDASTLPTRGIRVLTTASFDATTLAQNGYSADVTTEAGRQHTSASFAPGLITLSMPGQDPVALKASATAPIEILTDSLAGSLVLVLAELHALHAQQFTLAVTEGGVTVPASIEWNASAAHPAGVPANDQAAMLTAGPISGTLWYDPATFTVDEATVPSQNAEVKLLSRAVGAVAAVAPQSLAGTWSGTIPFLGAPQLFVLTIAQSGAMLFATAQTPYQESVSIPLQSVSVENGRLRFAEPRFDYSFDGTVGENAITGTFTQHGRSYPLTFVPSSLGTRDLVGSWFGVLAEASLPLVFTFARDSEGTLTATLDSPAQRAFGLPVSGVSLTGKHLVVTMSGLGAVFDGTENGATIDGTFTQRGVPYQLSLSRPYAGMSIAIPTPAPTPLPTPAPHFRSIDVSFSSTGAVLSGTLTIPDGARGRLPAFVFVHGSGPGTRNGAIEQNPTFLQLSNALSNAGYVVLRYDKRGIGESTGVATEDWRILGQDVRAAVAFLKHRPEVNPNRIILLGHSEGGTVVPLVAPSIPGVEGIVLMAPPAVSMSQILREQSVRMTPAMYRALLTAFSSYDGEDPAVYIRKVNVPILVLQGTRDIQVLPKDLHHLTDAARAAHKRLTVDMLSGDDHLFIRVPPGTPSDGAEYQIPSWIDPRLPRDIVTWMRANQL